MRLIPLLALLLAGGCGGETEPTRNIAAPSVPKEILHPANETAATPEEPGNPGLAGLSPSQRRVYERGYRDCLAGRYEPDRYSEAYRIGCAAAQDR